MSSTTHVLGKKNTKANALSQREDHDQGMSQNNDVIVLKEERFHRLSIDSIILKIRKNQDKLPSLNYSEKPFQIQDGLAMWFNKYVVPDDKQLMLRPFIFTLFS